MYAALMVATVMPTMGFGGYFIPLLAGVFYYATPENNWRELLWDHIPDWAAPRDLEMIRNLFEGAPQGAPLPWDAWLGPAIFWGLFMVAFFLVSFSLIALLHHQWAKGERLVYPLAVVPTAMVESVANPAKSLFRNPLFWAGFFIAATIPIVNMLDQLFDFETIHNFGIPSTRIFLRRIGISYGINVDFLVIGLSYLLNLHVLLSVWLFHILIYLEHGLLGFLGVGVSLPAQPHQQVSVLMSHQQMGALHLPDRLVAVDLARLPQRSVARYRQRQQRPQRAPAGAAHLGPDGRRRTGLHGVFPPRHRPLARLELGFFAGRAVSLFGHGAPAGTNRLGAAASPSFHSATFYQHLRHGLLRR